MKNVILDEFLNIENVYFSEPVKNTVIPNSTFRRIIYSNNYVSLNNIHLKIKLDNIKISKFYQKFKCMFNYHNVSTHNDILKITNIEKLILSKIKINDKLPKFSILEQARNGFIKFSTLDNNTYSPDINSLVIHLKISGIWENISEYGLTYKFCTN
jgi:hypothetical protein